MSRITRKPKFRLCENKGADQLRSNCEADQRLCFRYLDSTIPLLPKSEISSFQPYKQVCVGPGRKPRRLVFSCRSSDLIFMICVMRILSSGFPINLYNPKICTKSLNSRFINLNRIIAYGTKIML